MTYAESLERPKRWLLWTIANQLEQLSQKVEIIMSYKEDLMEIVEKQENLKVAVVTYVDSNNARMDQLEADLLAAIGTNAEVQELVAQAKADINADSEEVYAKLTANTPAEEPPVDPA